MAGAPPQSNRLEPRWPFSRDRHQRGSTPPTRSLLGSARWAPIPQWRAPGEARWRDPRRSKPPWTIFTTPPCVHARGLYSSPNAAPFSLIRGGALCPQHLYRSRGATVGTRHASSWRALSSLFSTSATRRSCGSWSSRCSPPSSFFSPSRRGCWVRPLMLAASPLRRSEQCCTSPSPTGGRRSTLWPIEPRPHSGVWSEQIRELSRLALGSGSSSGW